MSYNRNIPIYYEFELLTYNLEDLVMMSIDKDILLHMYTGLNLVYNHLATSKMDILGIKDRVIKDMDIIDRYVNTKDVDNQISTELVEVVERFNILSKSSFMY